MLDAKNAVLYVGKALDLKKRVNSYFQKKHSSTRIHFMVRQIAHIEVTITQSENEALLLEHQLIQHLKPRYNILFRDDKSYPYLKLSHHLWPQLSYFRGKPDKTHQYFGPFPHSDAVRSSIEILQRVFQLRTCEDTVFLNRSRPCLLYQIQQCSAPCVEKISSNDYQNSVKDTVLFLEGHAKKLFGNLSFRMQAASEQLDFEKAAKWRDKIQALTKIQATQFVSCDSLAHHIDVIAVVADKEAVCINLVMIRGGRHLGDKSFSPINADIAAPLMSLEAFLMHHYTVHPLPDKVILRNVPSDCLREYLCKQSLHRCNFIANPRGKKLVWLKMAEKNAQLVLMQKHLSVATAKVKHQSLQKIFNINALNRIECFDISHHQGDSIVASCVVYDKMCMQATEYRRYHIHTAKLGDDYQAMKEAIYRRYEGIVRQDEKCPDVILIDGGKGQIHVAEEVLNQLLLNIPIVGIAKHKSRQVGMEKLILANCDEILRLPADHLGFLLIQSIRDEAHRFALSGHRILRARTHITSTLEKVPHVGRKRRQRLLTHFKGLNGVMAASIDDLAKIDSIGSVLAEKIYYILHQ
jgi:excinuclease ABC subunit C